MRSFKPTRGSAERKLGAFVADLYFELQTHEGFG